jgi:hypothetical protein
MTFGEFRDRPKPKLIPETKRKSLALELVQVALIMALLRVVMLSSGIVFINIPWLDPKLRIFIANLQRWFS